VVESIELESMLTWRCRSHQVSSIDVRGMMRKAWMYWEI